MNKLQLSFLIYLSHNAGQLKFPELDLRDIAKMGEMDLLYSEKVRNSHYYYLTEKGKKLGQSLHDVMDIYKIALGK